MKYLALLFTLLVFSEAANRTVYKVILEQKNYAQFLQYDVEVDLIREFTLCSWVRFYNFLNNQTIFSYVDGNNNRVIKLWMSSGGYDLRISLFDKLVTKVPVKFIANNWNHVCLTYQADFGAWALYIDGRIKSCDTSQEVYGYIIPCCGSIVVGYGTGENGVANGLEGEIYGIYMILRSTISGRDIKIEKYQFYNRNRIRQADNDIQYVVLNNLSADSHKMTSGDKEHKNQFKSNRERHNSDNSNSRKNSAVTTTEDPDYGFFTKSSFHSHIVHSHEIIDDNSTEKKKKTVSHNSSHKVQRSQGNPSQNKNTRITSNINAKKLLRQVKDDKTVRKNTEDVPSSASLEYKGFSSTDAFIKPVPTRATKHYRQELKVKPTKEVEFRKVTTIQPRHHNSNHHKIGQENRLLANAPTTQDTIYTSLSSHSEEFNDKAELLDVIKNHVVQSQIVKASDHDQVKNKAPQRTRNHESSKAKSSDYKDKISFILSKSETHESPTISEIELPPLPGPPNTEYYEKSLEMEKPPNKPSIYNTNTMESNEAKLTKKDDYYDLEPPPSTKQDDQVFGQWSNSKFPNAVLNYLKQINFQARDQKKVPPTIPLSKVSDSYPYASDFKAKAHIPLKFQRQNFMDKSLRLIKRDLNQKRHLKSLQMFDDRFRNNIIRSHSRTNPISVEISNRGLNEQYHKPTNEEEYDVIEENSIENAKSSLQVETPKSHRLLSILPFLKSMEYFVEGPNRLFLNRSIYDDDLYSKANYKSNKKYANRYASLKDEPISISSEVDAPVITDNERIPERNSRRIARPVQYQYVDRDLPIHDTEEQRDYVHPEYHSQMSKEVPRASGDYQERYEPYSSNIRRPVFNDQRVNEGSQSQNHDHGEEYEEEVKPNYRQDDESIEYMNSYKNNGRRKQLPLHSKHIDNNSGEEILIEKFQGRHLPYKDSLMIDSNKEVDLYEKRRYRPKAEYAKYIEKAKEYYSDPPRLSENTDLIAQINNDLLPHIVVKKIGEKKGIYDKNNSKEKRKSFAFTDHSSANRNTLLGQEAIPVVVKTCAKGSPHNDYILLSQSDGTVDPKIGALTARHNLKAVDLIKLTMISCSLEDSSLEISDQILINWNKTPVRLFGGAYPKKTKGACGSF